MPTAKHYNELHHLAGDCQDSKRPDQTTRKWDAMITHHVDESSTGLKTRHVEMRLAVGDTTVSVKLYPDDAAELAYALLNRAMPNPAAYPELPSTVPPTGPEPEPTTASGAKAVGCWHCYHCGANGVYHAKTAP